MKNNKNYDLYYWAEENEYISNCIDTIINELLSKFSFVLTNQEGKQQELPSKVLQGMLRHYLLTGDAFIEVHYNKHSSSIPSFEVIPPEQLKYDFEEDKWFNEKNHVYYTDNELIHLYRPIGIGPFHDKYGISVIDNIIGSIENTYDIDSKQEISDEMVKWNIEQIVVAYGVPYHLVANIKDVLLFNGSYIESFENELETICILIKSSFGPLSPEYELEIIECESKKTEIYPDLFLVGLYTINEIREYFGLEQYPDEDGSKPAVINKSLNPLLEKDRDFLSLYLHSNLKI